MYSYIVNTNTRSVSIVLRLLVAAKGLFLFHMEYSIIYQSSQAKNTIYRTNVQFCHKILIKAKKPHKKFWSPRGFILFKYFIYYFNGLNITVFYKVGIKITTVIVLPKICSWAFSAMSCVVVSYVHFVTTIFAVHKSR